MMRCFPIVMLGLMLAAAAGPARADVALDAGGGLKLYGDFRFRLESDWDSHRADGSERDDRDRVRIRGRLGLKIEPHERFALELRLRTGSKASQQSPHITIRDFAGNPTSDHEVLLDKWFLKLRGERAWAWLGRNSFPFWKQNELFWDDDVTPAGVAVGYRLRPGEAELSLHGGYFALPDGGVDFHGELGAAQLVYSTQRDRAGFTAAGGLFLFRGEEGAVHLRNGNGARDYTIWVGSFQSRLEAGGRPLVLGLDLMHNSEDYDADDPDAFTAANRDQTNGVVASLQWGRTKEKGEWLLAYYYARIETLAVHASYAQDDWVRWGSATQTDAGDLQGHELRFAYALAKNMNLVARLYLVEAITSVQDGNRFRLDFNYRF
ncbi:MAG: hypothetical protein GY856_02420 [bacterium]|nr:hypothetical protein [bacterium]